MDYEFEAFKKGFTEGMATIWAVFDIKDEDIRKKLSLDFINNKMFELYQIWQRTLDKKLSRQDDILNKKVIQNVNKLKKAIVNYIETYKTL